jgi:transcriptional regulator with XRE-family HTH domain
METRLGKRIQALRRHRDLSCAELARGIGVSFHQMHRFETGHGRIDAATLWKLSQVLRVPVDELIDDGTPRGPTRRLRRRLH